MINEKIVDDSTQLNLTQWTFDFVKYSDLWEKTANYVRFGCVLS